MIWGYPYFRKPPLTCIRRSSTFFPTISLLRSALRSVWGSGPSSCAAFGGLPNPVHSAVPLQGSGAPRRLWARAMMPWEVVGFGHGKKRIVFTGDDEDMLADFMLRLTEWGRFMDAFDGGIQGSFLLSCERSNWCWAPKFAIHILKSKIMFKTRYGHGGFLQ